MARNLFSVPIFFIIFRETLEAAIIVSVLLGLAEQIVHEDAKTLSQTSALTQDSSKEQGVAVVPAETSTVPTLEDDSVARRRLNRKLRMQVRPYHSTHPTPHSLLLRYS